MITELTPEQEALIPIYREKWKAIALSTARIDRQKAVEIVKVAYEIDGLKEPEVFFFVSPKAAWRRLGDKLRSQVGNSIYLSLEERLIHELSQQIEMQLWSKLIAQTDGFLWRQAGVRQFHEFLIIKVNKRRHKWRYQQIFPEVKACLASLFDFCISVLRCTNDPTVWDAYQPLISHCGWIFPFERACLVSDRPTILSFDHEGQLHAEEEPAIQFLGGLSVCAHHGKLIDCQKPVIKDLD
jgi:hypothetical protein